jgi:AAA+ ATPase superfamily predicted ATPase
MNFVDRIEETARLRDALSREKSSLVVVYGRRRLGKSTLIKRVLSDRDVYFLADRSEGQHQRTLLAKVVAQVFPDFDKLTYPDWESLFRAVNYRTDKRFTLCLDEFPYLVEQSSDCRQCCRNLLMKSSLSIILYFVVHRKI